jgi:hypothetical protein
MYLPSFSQIWGNKAVLHPVFGNNAAHSYPLISTDLKNFPKKINIPQGYICYNPQDLNQAFLELRALGIHSLVIKPALFLLGGNTKTIRDISELQDYDFSNGPCVIQRRLLADINSMGKNQNCVVHFNGAEIVGNIMHQDFSVFGCENILRPSEMPERFLSTLKQNAQIILNGLVALGLKGPGSLQFLPERKIAYLIDINLRYTGRHPLLEFQQTYSSGSTFMSWEITPKKKSLNQFLNSLKKKKIAFDFMPPYYGVFPLCYFKSRKSILLAFGKDISHLNDLRRESIVLL